MKISQNHELLVDATNYVKTIGNRQNLKIACIEEIAYRMGFINKQNLLHILADNLKTPIDKLLIIEPRVFADDRGFFIPKRNERSELVHFRMSAGNARFNTPRLVSEWEPCERLWVQGLPWGMIPFIETYKLVFIQFNKIRK